MLPSTYSLSSESIVRLHKRDDAEISRGWRRRIFRFVPILAFANTGLYLAYLGLRIACVILAQNAHGITYPGAWVFLAIEIVVAIPSQMHNFWTMWAMKRRNRPKLRLRTDDVPTVDVFVTCCGEDDEVVLDTVRAACDQDYPSERFRVIVLDDGRSGSLEAFVGQLSSIYSNVYYMARQKIPGVPHHFKAGNLNYGLEQVDRLPGGAGEFMAALDADMVILSFSPEFLSSLSLTPSRFPSLTGCVLFFLICSRTRRWPSRVLHSCFTTLLSRIHLRRV